MATNLVHEADLSDKLEDALVVSNKFCIALVKNHKSTQQIIHEKCGSSLLDVMDALMKLPGLRDTLKKTILQTTHKPVCALEQMTSRHQTQSYKPREPKVQPNDKTLNKCENYKTSTTSQKETQSKGQEIDRKVNDRGRYKRSDNNLQKEKQSSKQLDKKVNDSGTYKKNDTTLYKESHNNKQNQLQKKTTVAPEPLPTADSSAMNQSSESVVTVLPSHNNNMITSTDSTVITSTDSSRQYAENSTMNSADNNSNSHVSFSVQETKASTVSITNQQLDSNDDLKELSKYYSDLVKSLPDNYMESVQKLQDTLTDEQIGMILDCEDPVAANQTLLDCLIKNVENKESILDFCDHLEKIKNSPKLQSLIEHLRKEVLSRLTQDDRSEGPTSFAQTGEERCASLRAFDHHYKHMMLVNPRYVKDKFVSQDFFTNGDPYADNASFLPNNTKMEGMLKTIRNSIALNGDFVLMQLIEVFHSVAMYAALGDKLIETYRALGGDVLLETCTNKFTETAQIHVMSDAELEEKLKWHNKQLQQGLLYQTPPPMPPNYIPRIHLLDVITKAVMTNKVATEVSATVILQGFGGFGKSTLAIGLCHQPAIQRYFLDGAILIKLGPKPPDPEMMLIKLYDQLTNEKPEQSSFTMENKLRWYVSRYLKRLLVIIDDVWKAQDALIYASVFNSCKIVLTTRKTNISTYIPAKDVIKIEEMSMDESKVLLTYRVVDTDKLNSSATKMLETLAQDLYRWPLLLGLVRNQLHSQIKLQSPFNQAIHKVQQNLYNKGLTAFDQNATSRVNKDSAVKACIDATLELLTQKELSNLKIIVLYAGTGVKIPISSLHYYWTDDVDQNLEKLSACGLVSVSKIALPPSICTLACIEMHAVITQYLVDSMDFGTIKQIFEGMNIANIQFMDWSFGSPEMEEDLVSDILDKIDLEALQSDEKYKALFTLQFSIGFLDNIGIPFSIQRVVILTKIMQQGIVEKLELFSEHFKSHSQLLSLVTKFKTKNTLKAEKAYMRFIKAYKEISSLLATNNYSAIMSALKNYIQDHPLQFLINNFSMLVQELVKSCKGNDALISLVMENADVKTNEWSLDGCLSCFEHQIKMRFAMNKLNKQNITMEEYLDTVMDICQGHLKWFDTNVVSKNRDHLMDQINFLDTEDDKASFDALTGAFSNIFERQPDLKTAIAQQCNINANLPLQDFVLSMIKVYIQTTPRTT